MCIRDSLWSAKRYDEAKEAFEKVLEIDPNVKSAPQLRRWICLLYTSDAADERSSVDLGGRRIIKKKT